jgi:hypothetical protein
MFAKKSTFAKVGKHTFEANPSVLAAVPCQKSMFANFSHNIVAPAFERK